MEKKLLRYGLPVRDKYKCWSDGKAQAKYIAVVNEYSLSARRLHR